MQDKALGKTKDLFMVGFLNGAQYLGRLESLPSRMVLAPFPQLLRSCVLMFGGASVFGFCVPSGLVVLRCGGILLRVWKKSIYEGPFGMRLVEMGEVEIRESDCSSQFPAPLFTRSLLSIWVETNHMVFFPGISHEEVSL